MYKSIESFSDNDDIHLFPTSSSTKPVFRKRMRKEHIELSYDYYIGIEKIRVAKNIPHYDDEDNEDDEDYIDINQYIAEEKDKFFKTIETYNNITDVIICKKKDLRKDIIANFRYCQPTIEYDEQSVNIDPYILGLWLGDGHSNTSSLTSIDNIIIEAWYKYAEKLGMYVTKSFRKERVSKAKKGETEELYSYSITTKTKFGKRDRNIFLKALTDYNLIKNKHIPPVYLNNSKEVRLKLLAGLIDTDGYYDRGVYEITQKSLSLSEDIYTLATSLGFYTQINKVKKVCTNSTTKAWNYYYRMYISINQISPVIPVLLERKKAKILSNFCNPKIVLTDDDIPKQIEWNKEKELYLMSVIKKFMIDNPESSRIPWVKLVKACPKFGNISSDALRAKYREIKNKYSMDDIDVCEDSFSTITDEWMNCIKPILNKIESDTPLTKAEKAWVSSQKTRKSHSSKQLELLSKIPFFSMSKFEIKWWEYYDDIYSDLQNGISLDRKQKAWIRRQDKLTDPKRKKAFEKISELL